MQLTWTWIYIWSTHFMINLQEIGLIFEVKRTASIRSENYCVIETLTQEGFASIIQPDSTILKRLKFQIFAYQDPYTLFLKVSIQLTLTFRTC